MLREMKLRLTKGEEATEVGHAAGGEERHPGRW